jgi:gliding motility-associated-like protein
MILHFKFLFFLLIISFQLVGQPVVDAGQDKTICPNVATSIGGNPSVSGGVPPYTILWSPATGLNSVTSLNPTVTLSTAITYTLFVKDSRDSTAIDSVKISINDIFKMNAGPDKGICHDAVNPVQLGNNLNYANPFTFKWLPNLGLSDSTTPQVNALPGSTTNYTLQITSADCGIKTDEVLVTVHDLIISAGNDTSIKEGETITLHATPIDSNLIYQWWSSSSSVNYNTTYNPDVSPKITSNFLLTITDKFGCKYTDYIKVEVMPSDDLVFYNSLSPNGDGDNDVWFIGNLEKYPENRVQIFNRYGQEVYSATNYKNNWGGKYLGNDLPGGTYYFVFDTKTNNKIFKGFLTIFR